MEETGPRREAELGQLRRLAACQKRDCFSLGSTRQSPVQRRAEYVHPVLLGAN
jgi:hypothetical protein